MSRQLKAHQLRLSLSLRPRPQHLYKKLPLLFLNRLLQKPLLLRLARWLSQMLQQQRHQSKWLRLLLLLQRQLKRLLSYQPLLMLRQLPRQRLSLMKLPPLHPHLYILKNLSVA